MTSQQYSVSNNNQQFEPVLKKQKETSIGRGVLNQSTTQMSDISNKNKEKSDTFKTPPKKQQVQNSSAANTHRKANLNKSLSNINQNSVNNENVKQPLTAKGHQATSQIR